MNEVGNVSCVINSGNLCSAVADKKINCKLSYLAIRGEGVKYD